MAASVTATSVLPVPPKPEPTVITPDLSDGSRMAAIIRRRRCSASSRRARSRLPAVMTSPCRSARLETAPLMPSCAGASMSSPGAGAGADQAALSLPGNPVHQEPVCSGNWDIASSKGRAVPSGTNKTHCGWSSPDAGGIGRRLAGNVNAVRVTCTALPRAACRYAEPTAGAADGQRLAVGYGDDPAGLRAAATGPGHAVAAAAREAAGCRPAADDRPRQRGYLIPRSCIEAQGEGGLGGGLREPVLFGETPDGSAGRKEFGGMLAPDMVRDGDADADDPGGLRARGLGLHAGQGEFARVVDALG